MPLTLEQLMALKQKMAAQSPRAVPPMTRQPVARGVAPGAYGYADGGDVAPLDAYMPTDAEAEASGFPPGPQRKQYIAQQRMNAAQRAAMPAPAAAPAQVAPNPANAAYMPTAQQQDASGLPPDPRRAAYMAARAAQAAGQPGYADGGTVNEPVATDARLRSLMDQKGLDQMVAQGILRGPGQADVNNAELQSGATGRMANPLYRRTVQPGSAYPTLPDVTEGADVAGPGNQPVDTSNAAMSDLQTKIAQQLAAKKAADAANSNGMADGGEVDSDDDSEVAEDASPAVEENSSREPSKLDALLAALPKGQSESKENEKEDDGLDDLREALNKAGDRASKEGEMAVNDATGKGVMEGKEVAEGAPKVLVLPNGGMEGKELAKYIAEHPGPSATIGKNLNTNSDKEENEDQDEEEAPQVAAKTLAKAPPTASKVPASVPNQAPAETSTQAATPPITGQDPIQTLMDKLGIGQQANDRLAQLQAQKQQMLQGQALLMGGDTIARAFARGRGAQMAPNTEYYNQMTARANAPIEAEMQRRAAVKDALNTGMTVYDLQDKQQADDPNSKPSQAAQKILLSTFPNLAGTSDLKNMSYSTIKGLAPNIENVLTNQTRLEAAKERAEYMQMARQSSNDQKQTNNFNQTIQQLESQRSTNPAVGQAEKDLYAAQKAQTIQNLAPNGDLNQLNPQMSKLIQMEVAKIAKGGVSDREDLRALDPSTLQGKLSGVWQELSNNPTPANAGAFLKQYMDYARGIQKDAQKVITDHYGRVINSKMNQFTPEQKEYMKDNYMNRFGDANSGAKSNAVGDYAPDVINYARAHNLTNEEALRIKNARTGG